MPVVSCDLAFQVGSLNSSQLQARSLGLASRHWVLSGFQASSAGAWKARRQPKMTTQLTASHENALIC